MCSVWRHTTPKIAHKKQTKYVCSISKGFSFKPNFEILNKICLNLSAVLQVSSHALPAARQLTSRWEILSKLLLIVEMEIRYIYRIYRYMLVTTTIVMLLFKHKIINKKMKKESRKKEKKRTLYVSTSRLDTYISYDKSKRKRRRRRRPIYTYIWIYYIVVL